MAVTLEGIRDTTVPARSRLGRVDKKVLRAPARGFFFCTKISSSLLGLPSPFRTLSRQITRQIRSKTQRSAIYGHVEDPLAEFGIIIEFDGEFTGALVVAAQSDVVFVLALHGEINLVIGATAHVGGDHLDP